MALLCDLAVGQRLLQFGETRCAPSICVTRLLVALLQASHRRKNPPCVPSSDHKVRFPPENKRDLESCPRHFDLWHDDVRSRTISHKPLPVSGHPWLSFGSRSDATFQSSLHRCVITGSKFDLATASGLR